LVFQSKLVWKTILIGLKSSFLVEMMCFGPSPHATNESTERNRQINRDIFMDRKNQNKVVKLLLLGAGDSGKSTIAKQMKIIHLDGFSEEELIAYKDTIANNILTAIRTLIHQNIKFGYQFLPENLPRVQRISDIPRDSQPFITRSIGEDIMVLWKDPSIQRTFLRSSEYQLNDSTQYYMEALDRISSAGYIPIVQDVLRSRVKTAGVLETTFEVEDIVFKLVDVGGQRSERRKWIHCFEDVTAIIFCVALSEYDLMLYEHNETNRMHESLQLFKELCNSKWFAKTSFVMFFNKKDIFAEKIKRVPLTVCFPEYSGTQEFKDTSEFIIAKFLAVKEHKQVYTHLTCATDTSNVIIVFNAVRDIILDKTLKNTFGV